MKFLTNAVAMLAAIAVFVDSTAMVLVEAKRPKNSASASRRSGPRPSGSSRGPSGGKRPSKRPPVTKPRFDIDEEDDFEADGFERSDLVLDDFDDELEEEAVDEEDAFEDDYDDEYRRPTPRKRPPPQRSSKRQQPPPRKKKPATRRFEEDEFGDDGDDYDYDRPQPRRRPPPSQGKRGPPPRRGGPPRRGAVVPYGNNRGRVQPSAFTRGLTAIKSYVPDPSAVRESAVSSLSAARSTTSNLSSNLYREVKGLASSELEQVMLKATRPDDSPVKAKHVERLVKVSYQISSRFDIYDAVLRKLWSKMSEKDWRTTIKALYILHCFSADGSPQHANALKARIRELRRTHDPKRKEKYFSSKLILAGDSNPENVVYRAFMSRYAHYVLLRAQCFCGMFSEISTLPKPPSGKDKRRSAAADAAAKKPITSTSLRMEHYDAAVLLLKAGMACQLKEGEDCDNTVNAVERVASDMIGLSASVAIALNRALAKEDGYDPETIDAGLIRKWCEFYKEELLPQTRAMVKKMSSKLDAYGLYLPSRMGTTVSPDVLQKGMNLASTLEKKKPSVDDEDEEEADEPAVEEDEDEEVEAEPVKKPKPTESSVPKKPMKPEPAPVEDEEVFDEYEYEYDEYDDEL